MSIGIAIGSQNVTLIDLSLTEEEVQEISRGLGKNLAKDTEENQREGEEEKEKKDKKAVQLPYSREGLAVMLSRSKAGEKVIISGNKQWAKAFAYALRENNRDVRYLPAPRRQRGAKQNNEKLVRLALEKGFEGRPFFREKSLELHSDVVLGNEYFLALNELRQIKHRIINNLRLLYPEVIVLGTRLWTKGRVESLETLDWQELGEDVDVAFTNSIARYVPGPEQLEAAEKIRQLMSDLSAITEKVEELREEIVKKTADHPVVKYLGGGVSAHLIALFVGWRKWGSKRKAPDGFRALRHFCGLNVSLMDSKGKMRISRTRPNVRTAVFWALRTAAGKKEVAPLVAIRKEAGKKTPRPKRLERLLLRIWQKCLKVQKPAQVY